MQILTKLLHS